MHHIAFLIDCLIVFITMSWSNRFNDLVNKAEAKLQQHNHPQYQQQPYPAGSQQQQQYLQQCPQQYSQQNTESNLPPPIPYASKPSFSNPNRPQPSQQPQAYWTFDPSSPVSTTFTHKTGQHGWGNNELQNYTSDPRNAFYAPSHTTPGTSVLIIQALATSSAPTRETQYTSARLVTNQLLGRRRGYLHIRVTLPIAQGIWPAIWLLPREPFAWPGDGEVDVVEMWNGERINHSCLHWGHFNGEDWNKHRVIETEVPGIQAAEGAVFGLAWEEGSDGDRGERGRLVWYVDGRAVMKARIPQGARRLEEWNVVLNVAMGGNVCQGKVPQDGVYQMVVHELKMCEEPVGGWQGFERDWSMAKEGHP